VRRCRRCGEEKDPEEFPYAQKSRRWICGACWSAMSEWIALRGETLKRESKKQLGEQWREEFRRRMAERLRARLRDK
jgi:hypothetical protein